MKAAEGILTAAAASSRTPRWSAGRWARSASSARRACRSTTHAKTVTVDGSDLKEGDFISIDGFTGEVYRRPGHDRAARDRRRC